MTTQPNFDGDFLDAMNSPDLDFMIDAIEDGLVEPVTKPSQAVSESARLGGWESLKAANLGLCPRCSEPFNPGQWVINDDGQHVAHHHCPGPWSRHVTEPPKVMSEEELRASVFEFVANLSEESGVDIDPEEVWTELMARKAKS